MIYIIASLKRIIKKDIVKVLSLTAISTIIRMLTGFISIKVIAALIGPAGLALLGQLNNFSTIFLTISTGGINSGITKYIAEYSESREKVALYLTTGLWITAIMSLAAGSILLVGARFFSNIVFHDTKYVTIVVILGITLIFYSLNGLLLSILNGFKDYKKFVTINIFGSIIGLLFSCILALSFGVYGALLSTVTFQSFALIITISVARKCPWFNRGNFIGSISKTALKKLGHYSFMALISAATLPVSQLIIRGFIGSHSSLSEAGLWEGINRISAMYLMVITSSLSIYYLPRLSEINNEMNLRIEILNTYKIILPPLLVMLFMIFFLRNFIIEILFSDKFIGIQDLFAFQLIGDFFKICSWILAFQMVAKSMTITYVITEIVSSIVYVILAIFSIRMFGTIGATIGYAIASVVYFGIIIIIFRKLIFRFK